jgi:protocatechuate 3,4-dioxygenase, beta subunit
MDTYRRTFLRNLVHTSSAFFVVRGAFAEELVRTPAQTEGPFYPDKLPLDTDNDLIVINNGITPAVGEITWMTGRILGSNGQPVRNALVEIWQCDNNGAYLHSKTSNADQRDRNFQGYGRFLTGSGGEYLFRTIKPVPYPGRTPHIHVMVRTPRQEKFVTQCYVKGEPRNATDGPLKGLKEGKAKDSIIVPFTALPNSRIGELSARFDVVLGFTPEV